MLHQTYLQQRSNNFSREKHTKTNVAETANIHRFESSIFAGLFGSFAPIVIYFHSGFGWRKGWPLDCTALFVQSGTTSFV